MLHEKILSRAEHLDPWSLRGPRSTAVFNLTDDQVAEGVSEEVKLVTLVLPFHPLLARAGLSAVIQKTVAHRNPIVRGAFGYRFEVRLAWENSGMPLYVLLRQVGKSDC